MDRLIISIGKKSIAKLGLLILFTLLITFMLFQAILSRADFTPMLIVQDPVIKGNLWSRKVTVYHNDSQRHYNVPVSVAIEEGLSNIELYRYLTENLMKRVTDNPDYSFQIIDIDNNGKNDTVAWIIPELSEVNFAVEGVIIEEAITMPEITTPEIKTQTEIKTSSGYQIRGDYIKWENDFGTLKVYTHTCHDSVCTQYANITSKIDQDIDLNFSFVFPEKIKGNLWIWQNYSHSVRIPEVESCTISEKCLRIINSTLCEITAFDGENQTCSYIQDGYCYWNDTCRVFREEEKWFYDWNDKTYLMNYLKHENKHYYYLSDVPFEAFETKQVKWQYRTKIRERDRGWGSSGKWELYVWRGDYKNPTEYVKLDPWWDSTWEYRTNFTITEETGEDLTDYTLNITVDTSSLTNFYCGGERWINSSNNELDFWTESCSVGGDSVYWVKIPSMPASSSENISIYYGNTTPVTDLSNGTAAFVDFDDFEYTDSVENHGWVIQADCGDPTRIKTQTSVVAFGSRALEMYDNSGSGNCRIARNFTGGGQTRFETHLYIRDTHTGYPSSNQYWNVTGSPVLHATTNLRGNAYHAYRSSACALTNIESYSANTWYEYETVLNTSGDTYERHDINGVNKLTDTSYCDDATSFSHFRLAHGGTLGTGTRAYFDYYFTRKYTSPEPSYSQGSEETEVVDVTPPVWNDAPGYLASNTTTPNIGEAVLLYAQGKDEGGLDWAWLETNETGTWKNYTTGIEPGSYENFDNYIAQIKHGWDGVLNLSEEYCPAGMNLTTGYNFQNDLPGTYCSAYIKTALGMYAVTGNETYLDYARWSANTLNDTLRNKTTNLVCLYKRSPAGVDCSIETSGTPSSLFRVASLAEKDSTYNSLVENLADAVITYHINETTNLIIWKVIPTTGAVSDDKTYVGYRDVWVVQALLKAYEATNNETYLNKAYDVLTAVWDTRDTSTNLIPSQVNATTEAVITTYMEQYSSGAFLKALLYYYYLTENTTIYTIINNYTDAVLKYVWDETPYYWIYRVNYDGSPSMDIIETNSPKLSDAMMLVYDTNNTKYQAYNKSKLAYKYAYRDEGCDLSSYDLMVHGVNPSTCVVTGTSYQSLFGSVGRFIHVGMRIAHDDDNVTYYPFMNKTYNATVRYHKKSRGYIWAVNATNPREAPPDWESGDDPYNPNFAPGGDIIYSLMMLIRPTSNVNISWTKIGNTTLREPMVITYSGFGWFNNVHFNDTEKTITLDNVTGAGIINFTDNISWVNRDNVPYGDFSNTELTTTSGSHSYKVSFKPTGRNTTPQDMGDAVNTWVWSNFTWINSSVSDGTVIGWRIYYNDTAGNENVTDTMSFTITVPDTTSPTYSDNQTNDTTAGEPILFSLNWTDNVGLSGYRFYFHNGSERSSSFGNETAGSSWGSINDYIRGSVFTMPRPGKVSSITAYIDTTIIVSTNSIKCAIYDHNLSFIAETEQKFYGTDTTGWETFSFSSPPILTDNTDYILVCWGQCLGSGCGVRLAYTAGETNQGHWDPEEYGSWPDSLSPSHDNNAYSIFANYTYNFTVDDWTSFGDGTEAWSNVTKIVNDTVGVAIKWYVKANDTSDNWNTSEIFEFLTADTTPPTFSNNATNTTVAGTPIEHRLNWTDNAGLSGYIFSFDNGTADGSFGYTQTALTTTDPYGYLVSYRFQAPSDGTLQNMTIFFRANLNTNVKAAVYNNTWNGTHNIPYLLLGNSTAQTITSEDWWTFDINSYNRESVNLTKGDYYWLTFMVDTDNGVEINHTDGETGQQSYISYTYGDFPDPFDSNPGIKDEVALIYANYTGMINDTWVSMIGTGNWSNVTKVVNDTVGTTIRWCVYANDTSNNWNGTSCVNPFSYTTTYNPNLSDCSVLDQDGATYYLTTDILNSGTSYCINISANNVSFDCQGYTIDGDDVADYGIYVYRSSSQYTNVTVKNCNVTDWGTANIYLYNANDSTLENITSLSSPDFGIRFTYSSNNQIINSTVIDNYDGIYLESSSDNNQIINSTVIDNDNLGIRLTYSSNNQIINSTVSENAGYDFTVFATSDSHCDNYLENVTGSNNLPIKYYNSSINLSNEVLSELILCNADYSNITNITIDASQTKKNNMLYTARTDYSNFTEINSSYNYDGILLRFSSNNNQIINSTVIDNDNSGISLVSSSNNQIINSTVIDNDNLGIRLSSSSNNNQIINSTVNGNWDGIGIYSSSNNNQIINSTVNSNSEGIYISSSHNITIHSNRIQGNSQYGIDLSSSGSTPNKIYNNLFNNTNNFYFWTTVYLNYWNTTKQEGDRIYSPGTEIGGNYWTNSTGNDYSDTCTDSDKDGFCDNYYELHATGPNRDYLPLSDEYSAAYLEVSLEEPPTTYNVIQNQIFTINATVFCRNADCGNVNGTAQYNGSSENPDTPINITEGDKPFFINETPAVVMKNCPTNPLSQDEFCNITWTVNATGDIDSVWKIGVLFNSTSTSVGDNHTDNSTVTIVSCTESIVLWGDTLYFGTLTPNTPASDNPATDNTDNLYNITNNGGCSLSIWIKGTDLTNDTYQPPSVIGVGNITWTNISSTYDSSYPNLTTSFSIVNSSLPVNANVTTYYWVNVPPVYAGAYNGTITICGNSTSVCD